MSSNPANSNSSWVVVPDGLAADADGHALPEPSFVYRAVLEWTAQQAGAHDHIYLAPANRFGSPITEQEAGRRYLAPLTTTPITCAASPGSGYVDTRGNARLLRQELERQRRWPLAHVRLVAYATHLPRAIIAFTQEGFTIQHADGVTIPAVERHQPGTLIVRRLWYYRYPAVHHVYERLALALTRLRVI